MKRKRVTTKMLRPGLQLVVVPLKGAGQYTGYHDEFMGFVHEYIKTGQTTYCVNGRLIHELQLRPGAEIEVTSRPWIAPRGGKFVTVKIVGTDVVLAVWPCMLAERTDVRSVP